MRNKSSLQFGWGDYYEAMIGVAPNNKIMPLKLINGSTGKYVGEGTRASFEKNVSGVDILTTTDQYKYGFDSSTNKIIYMQDRSGNRINLSYTDGKLKKITDTAGREYILAYGANGFLSSVTDPAGRAVTYTYNSDNLLIKVTDPAGGALTYEYDTSQYLTNQIDQNGNLFQQLKYLHNLGSAENKVIESKDAAGETWSYSYDLVKSNTTITNNNEKKWTYWYNFYMDTIRVQDPEGKSTYTEYDYSDSTNYFGDITAKIDRNGNRTDYVIDHITGNTTKVTNPDGGMKSYVYDKWNNVIEETNEVGSRTFYLYDTQGAKLLKKAQPLNGTSNYIEGNTKDFAVTTYTYYTKSEAGSLFGCNVDGLKKTETDPEGNTTTYTYTSKGDIASMKDASDNVTAYTYDTIGQKLSETTPTGFKTQWNYDKNGKIIKEVYPDGGIKRYVYDKAGNIVLEVNPNQYNAALENATTGVYSGTEGTKYEWYASGYQKAVIDTEGNRTEYTWDIYGNKATEKKPNGAIYRYVYDSLNRLTKTYFKENASAGEVLLSEISYGILSNGNDQTTTTEYADSNQKYTTTIVKDYADREVEIQYADYSRVITKYNLDGAVKEKTAANGAITYYCYSALGDLTNVWNPMSIIDGNTKYSWTGYGYDKSGNMISEKAGKTLVALNETTEDVYTKQYLYIKGLLKQQIDSDGRKTEYTYNKDGKVELVSRSVSATEVQTTKTLYNYRGQATSVTKQVRAGDIQGYSDTDNNKKDCITSNTYDLNGNLITVTDAAGIVTKYTYDKLNRNLTATKLLSSGQIITSQTYTWDGQMATQTDANGKTTTYTYDAMGNQIKKVDPLGNTTLMVYDLMKRNTVIVSPKNYKSGSSVDSMERTEFIYDAMGRVLSQKEFYYKLVPNSTRNLTKQWVEVVSKEYQYDALGNVIETKDALGNTTTSSYNLAGIVETVTDAETKEKGLPFTVSYTYNGLGQKVKETYQNITYTYAYDGSGNLIRTEADGVMKSAAGYDLLGRKISITDALGNVTTQQWNALDKISKKITPGDSTIGALQTIYQYDLLGNLAFTKDSLGIVNTYLYNGLSRNTGSTVKNEAGTLSITTSTAYDANGNILSKTDGNNKKTSYTYDSLNRVITKTNPLGQTTTYTYDANGNKTSEKDYLGNVATNVYDGINRLVETRDAYNQIVQQILYNDADAQISSFDALNHETRFLYDKNMRQTTTIDAEGHASGKAYDSRGNISFKKDGNGTVTSYQYDGEGHLAKVTDALGSDTSYTYDGAGNLLSQTDGNGNTTTYRYNAANLLVTKTDPAGISENYTYYANGKMASKTDRKGIVTSYTYDVFGRLVTEASGGEVQSYTYDSNNNMLTMTDSTGTTTRTYDALNRNITKTVPVIGRSTYEYDLPAGTAGEYLERNTDPKGNVTVKTYDKVGRLSKVTVGADTTIYQYNANGTRQSVTYPGGTTETYAYNKNNQVTSLINTKAGGTVISSYLYTYDAAGNQLTKTESKGTTTYTYDSLNRLSTVTEPGGKKTSYTYDGAGNRKTEQVEMGLVSATTLYHYNSQNRLTSTLSSNGAEARYLYDQNGNLLSKTEGILKMVSAENLTAEDLPGFDLVIRRGGENGTGTEKLTTYTYDNYNRLIQTKSAHSTSTYRYNAQGYRVLKKVNSISTNYLYEGDKVVLETNENNVQKAFQVYGTNLLYRSAAADGNLGAQSCYYLYNAHGDVTALINSSGNTVVTYDYDAFGNIINQTGTTNNSIKYAGYQHDEESGLYYLNARYYDSVTARFITEDTYTGQKDDPLSLNLYTYCSNNPIIYIDPTGHVAGSIVDYLKSKGKNSSYSARKELAKDLGIKNYTGTGKQNTQMLNTLKKQESAKLEAEKRESAKRTDTVQPVVTEKVEKLKNNTTVESKTV